MRNIALIALAASAVIAAPLVAQSSPDQGMEHGNMRHDTMPMQDQGMQHQGMQHQGMQHQGMQHDMASMANDPRNPYGPAEMQMHHRMMQATGADDAETWVRKMIEHHRGAIEMSRIALREAADPQVRTMAQKTITMQNQDIARLQAWLTRHGKRPQ